MMPHHMLKPIEVKNLLDQGNSVLIDVREPAEFREESIPGAHNIPLSSLSPNSLNSFKDKTIIVQCQSGNRSKKACEKVKMVASKIDVKDLEGGITEWKKAGLPVESSGTACSLPLMRQVQLAIGLFVIAGTILSYFISSTFLIIPLIMGVGLANTGLTGWCGLAKLMALMPWNR
jgi:rhodanese-related sulfurtransferase